MKKIIPIIILIFSVYISLSLEASSTTFLPLADKFREMNSTLFNDNYNRNTSDPTNTRGITLLRTTRSLSRYIGYRPQLQSSDGTGFSTYFQFEVSSGSADGFVLVFSESFITGAGPWGGLKAILQDLQRVLKVLVLT